MLCVGWNPQNNEPVKSNINEVSFDIMDESLDFEQKGVALLGQFFFDRIKL